MRVSFIGAGVMAEAIVRGLCEKKVLPTADILVSDVRPERCQYLHEKFGVTPAAGNVAAVQKADITVLAVKPQVLSAVLQELSGHFRAPQVVLSIVAGASSAGIAQGLNYKNVVRAMPNTPAQIGRGVTVWMAAPEVAEDRRTMVRSVLQVLGREFYVAREDYINMATAVSGSGPAYVFLTIEALIDAAVHIGLPRELAVDLVMGTVSGSTELALTSGKHPADLRNQVTSPGGTTAAALLKLEEGKLRALFTEAVVAAYDRARALDVR